MEEQFMQEAINLALEGMRNKDGGPFGAVIVKNGEIVGRGSNAVTDTLDPTAHAEVVAIRDACKNLNSFQLDGCEIYTTCEPCPMCLGAIYWARPDKVYYSCNKTDAADVGFDDDFIYKELDLPLAERKVPFVQMSREESLKIFGEWKKMEDKTEY